MLQSAVISVMETPTKKNTKCCKRQFACKSDKHQWCCITGGVLPLLTALKQERFTDLMFSDSFTSKIAGFTLLTGRFFSENYLQLKEQQSSIIETNFGQIVFFLFFFYHRPRQAYIY